MYKIDTDEDEVVETPCDKCKRQPTSDVEGKCLFCGKKKGKKKPVYPDRFLANDPIEW